MFRALIVDKGEDGAITAAVQEIDEARLPEAEVLVRVTETTVNYKDGLCLTGGGGLVRTYPHVPGIDLAGEVLESADARYKPGDKVVLTGWRVGEAWWGGYAQRARVRADWLVPLPEALSTRQCMAIGTAGFTAMLAVMALEAHGLKPGGGPVLVTGAAGGVGSVATAVLAKLGHEVVAVTGRPDQESYLTALGAARVIGREGFEGPGKPLEKAAWAGCIDAVGGVMLGRVLAQMEYGASVAAVGNAGGIKLETTVIPFLLRGVNLLGIDSVMRPYDNRVAAWSRLARDLDLDLLESMIEPATLDEVPSLGRAILKGQVRGRVVVEMD